MNIEQLREYCISKKAVEEGFPFDEDTLVFKVGGKMFLLLSLSSRLPQFNVKCDPAKAIELREKYSYITPGFHMSKVHWNTVVCEDGASSKIILNCIDESYSLVVSGLTAKTRKTLGL